MTDSARQLLLPTDRNMRQAMLQEIVDQLDLTDRRALAAMIRTKNDTLPTLPAELIIRILDFLPMFEASRLQLVCRSWRHLFSEDAILRSAFAHWETHDASDMAKHRPQETVVAKSRRIIARRRGQPSSSANFTWACSPEEATVPLRRIGHEFVALKGRHFAYLDTSNGHCVALRDLIELNRPMMLLRPKDRAAIRYIALSSSIFACITHSGKLAVRSILRREEEGAWLQLPSTSLVRAVHADGNIVAIVTCTNSSERLKSWTASLICYDYDTGKLNQYYLDCPLQGGSMEDEQLRPAPRAVLVNARAGTIDIFYSIEAPQSNTVYLKRLEHRRHSLQGNLISQTSWSSLEQGNEPDRLGSTTTNLSWTLRPTGLRRRYAFGQMYQVCTSCHNRQTFLLTFDADREKFEAQTVCELENRERSRPEFAVWKNILLKSDGHALLTLAHEATEHLLSERTPSCPCLSRESLTDVCKQGGSATHKQAKKPVRRIDFDDKVDAILTNDSFVVVLCRPTDRHEKVVHVEYYD